MPTDTLAVQWFSVDPNDAERLNMLETVAAFIKKKEVPVANVGMLKPGDVLQRVAPLIAPRRFRMHGHTRCWKHCQVRPSSLDPQPEVTTAKYCQYNRAHQDYVYTEAWVEFLVKQLSDEAKYKRALQLE